MRNTIWICLLLATTLLVSCAEFSKKQKINLYYEIVHTNDTLTRMTKEWHQLLKQAVREKDYNKLRAHRMAMGTYLDRRRSALGTTKVYAYSESIIDREATYLANRATIVSDTYPPFESFNALTPVETIQDQLKSVSDDLVSAIAADAGMKRALDEYIKVNKLKLPKN